MRARTAWRAPATGERVEVSAWGPFVVRELVREPDGTVVEYSSRRHRKGLGPHRPAAVPERPGGRVVWEPRVLGWWIAVLFMIGSICFAVGSAPGVSSVLPPGVVGAIVFTGSLFFTSAGYSQFVEAVNAGRSGRTRLVAWQPSRIDWWATAVQLAGTIWFNVDTFFAMQTGLTTQQTNLRVWTPDFVGSICFLVASWLATEEECHGRWRPRWHDVAWRIVWLNMLGSVFFMASAIAAFVRPSTGDLVSATIANTGTFLGALCFLWGAELLLVELSSALRLPRRTARAATVQPQSP